jgi:predicted RNA binding protein YcfA (HicA-like mRNA interferase family)
MPKPVETKKLIKALIKKGFVFISQQGSHAKYRKIGSPTLTVIVPMHGKEIPYGTFRSILRQSKLSENNFDD